MAPQREVSSLRAGTLLGDFEIEAPIARGGMGVVYRARQLSLGRRAVAVKVLDGATLGADADRIGREALRAASLHHPNLAEVYGFGAIGSRVYYAMQLVEGPTLRHTLERLAADRTLANRDATRRVVVRQVTEVADALAAVHRAGLVHRDVKPSNIVLQSDGAPIADAPAVLVDFGLARPIEPRTETGPVTTSATVAYAAPEQLLGLPVDGRTDVFALGVTLHDLLAARIPTQRGQASIGLEPLEELVPGIDRDLSAIVGKATDHKPEWRYQSAEALRADLLAWLADAAVSARRLPPFERARRWVLRHPDRVLRFTARAASVVLVVALLVVAAVSVSDLRSLSREIAQADAHGDIETLVESLAAVPGPLGPWILSPACRELRQQIAEGDTSDPAIVVASFLRRGGWEEAMLLAASHLERDGIGAHPRLASFLLNHLAGRTEGAPIEPAQRSRALLLTGRLFLDRPDRTPEDSVSSESFRHALVSLLRQRAADADDRLFALLALSGCGTTDTIGALWDWLDSEITDEHVDAETCRMTVIAAARILRNTLARGETLPASLGDSWLHRCVQRMRALTTAPLAHLGSKGVWSAWGEFIEAFAWMQRDRIAISDLGAVPWPDIECNYHARIRAILRDPALAEWLGSGDTEGCDFLTAPDRLGWCAEASNDLVLEREAKAVLSTSLGWEKAFERGREEARRESRGDRFHLEPHVGTHLGYREGGATLDAELGTLDGTLPITLGRPVSSLPSWEFVDGQVVAEGCALPDIQVTNDLERWDDDSNCLAFRRFGVSTLSLPFEAQEPPADLTLQLRHFVADRVYVPYGGSARVSIMVDQREVGSLTIDVHGGRTDSIGLAAQVVGPGRHMVTIRLVSATGVYCVERVALARS